MRVDRCIFYCISVEVHYYKKPGNKQKEEKVIEEMLTVLSLGITIALG